MKDKQRGRRHRWGKQVDHSMGLNRRNCPTEHLERFMANVMGTRKGLSVVSASMFIIGWEKPGKNLASS